MLTEKWNEFQENAEIIPSNFLEIDWRVRNWKEWFGLHKKDFEKLETKA